MVARDDVGTVVPFNTWQNITFGDLFTVSRCTPERNMKWRNDDVSTGTLVAHPNDCNSHRNFVAMQPPSAIKSVEMTYSGFLPPFGTVLGPHMQWALYTGLQCISLPVEMEEFSAAVKGDVIELNWSTLSETNNAGFKVEHALGRANFTEVGYVPGHGTTQQAHVYSFSMPNRLPGSHRFRLRQMDYDGSFAYSEVVEVGRDLVGEYFLRAFYPNPFNPTGQFGLIVAENQHVEIGVYTMIGQQVAVLHSGLLRAHRLYAFSFEASQLPSGPYIISVQGAQFADHQKVMLLK